VDVAEAVVGGGGGWIEREGVMEGGLGLAEAMEGGKGVAVVCPRECEFWVSSERGLGHAQRGKSLVALAGDEAEAQKGELRWMAGVEGLAIGLGGLQEMALGVMTAGLFERGNFEDGMPS
jgi:hypothetical protein